MERDYPQLWDRLGRDFDQMQFNIAWGKLKEAFGMCAAKAVLPMLEGVDMQPSDELRETGFTSCVAHRCASFVHSHNWVPSVSV